MKKRSYALIFALILMILMIGFVGWKLSSRTNQNQPEFSLAIADTSEPRSSRTASVSSEQTVISTAGLSETSAETQTTALSSSSESKTAKTKQTQTTASALTTSTTAASEKISEAGSYTSKDDVALYIHTYGKLPSNFITKNQAKLLGWEGGSLEPYAPGKSIGGDKFGNFEGLLPSKQGRKYTECDIDTKGKSQRGAKRIIFSNDGLIYYTDDHYKSFTLLYGEE